MSYHLGLDIGTASVGWAIMDEDYNLLNKHGQKTMGVRVFSEGDTAAQRRSFRTTRRRLKRRKWRLSLLEEIFASHINKVDPNFFARLKESNLSPKDEKKKFKGSLLFPDMEGGDANHRNFYPTIYHLRRDLMLENRKFDIREIYLALHHIVKYRGHFLEEINIDDLSRNTEELTDILEFNLKDWLHFIGVEGDIDYDKIKEILLDKTKTINDKGRELKKLLGNNKFVETTFKLILGAGGEKGVNLTPILKKEKSDIEKIELKFSSDDIEQKLNDLSNLVPEDVYENILKLKKVYNALELEKLMPNGKYLSEGMVDLYKIHREHLKKLKQINLTKEDKLKFEEIYSKYKDGQLVYDKFAKNLKDILKNYEEKEAIELLKEIEIGQVMPKQRTNQNNIIPHQVHQIELRKIIENQGQYYPWLLEENPIAKHRKFAPYKLEELVIFRVPYYVGPMIDQKDASGDNGKFAWMVRKEDGAITPWNFDQKVDREKSANKFILRMTAKDTYLLGEDVLPKSSLLYQAYMVLNELNSIKINDQFLDVSLKQQIFNEIFKKQKTVKANKVINLVKGEYLGNKLEINGLSNGEKFNSSLSTYINLMKIIPFDFQEVDKVSDIEKIINWLTIFEDRNIFVEKAKAIDWLTDKQIEKLKTLNLSGWGRLSKKLLLEIKDENDNSIVERMWNSKNNFMQIVNEKTIKEQIDNHNASIMKKDGIEDILDEAYMSPKNKKAIRQVIKVVDDLVDIMGEEPETISIEFTRDDKESKKSLNRKQVIEKMYKDVSDDIVDKYLKAELKNYNNLSEKIYLYFTQLGHDVYTGEKIDLNNIQNYEIDHIVPQSVIKDDSVNNKVLVHKQKNIEKSQHFAMDLYGNNSMKSEMKNNNDMKISDFWKLLHKNNLISKTKLDSLFLTEQRWNSDNKLRSKFIARQLVETSTTIKVVSNYLDDKFENTKVIEVRSKLTSELRKKFILPKLRNLNDYHHALDAYITTIIGKYLLDTKPKYQSCFIYGNYLKYDKDAAKEIRNTNVLYQLVNFEFKEAKRIKENLEKAYNYIRIPVSREILLGRNRLFFQTIFKAGNSKAKVGKKKDLDPKIYGGYSQIQIDHLSLIKLLKKNKIEYRLVAIPVYEKEKLKNDIDNKELRKIIEQKVKGNFEIILPVVHIGQLLKSKDGLISLVSDNEYKNEQQPVLKLSEAKRRILQRFVDKDKKLSSEEYDWLFAKTLDMMENMKLYQNDYMKLKEFSKYFVDLNLEEKDKIVNQIFQALKPYGSRQDIEFKKGKKISSMGRFVARPKIDEDTIFVMKSPSGLRQRKIRVGNL